ncbi:electron transport complex subunit RsxD [Aliidiomarina taiwanensis]|uniref:Ion-translocating oxidoreductase complex subunit D n=1 Tax=Aliidiomarina taiwanensis TaxID=946228 RepID=A0A432X278_9GAMM|nr:electron transport complex subunit RsxD [Aliidiomarina taiwanensis]RUO40558.1 electron transport complex subunit RsxD [Aliidiomarina taiwanensis]
MSFYIASSPHHHVRRTTHDIMRWVLLAMVPGVLAQLYFFGWGVLFQLVLAICVALFAEAGALFLRHRPIKPALHDYSAVVTAALLAVSIPPLAPWWVILIGTLFAILVVKHMFGGIGQNIFNPAMAAYVMLLVSFPVQMTAWMPPAVAGYQAPGLFDSLWLFFTTYTAEGYSLEQVRLVWSESGLDAMAMATPLDHIKTEVSRGFTLAESMQSAIFSWFAGAGWQWVNLAFLAGGLTLLVQRIITWHIPVALLSSLGLCAILGALASPDLLPGFNIHLLSGGTMLAAFFIATDPVSAATSNKGKLVYAALIGLLIYIIRTWGGYPDAVAFAVLLGNLCVPVIDQYTRPQTYGHGEPRP